MEVLFATSNRHKVAEANRIGRRFGVRFRRISAAYPEVRDNSVSKVALEGVDFAYKKTGKPVVVEDSGLFIKALNGFPGPYSRYILDSIGLDGILKLMRGRRIRSAFFVSAVAYSDGKNKKVFEGRVEGSLTPSKKGSGGFGYDPLFKPKGCPKTFAEDPLLKDRISHRAKAVELFCRWLSTKN